MTKKKAASIPVGQSNAGNTHCFPGVIVTRAVANNASNQLWGQSLKLLYVCAEDSSDLFTNDVTVKGDIMTFKTLFRCNSC